MDLGKILQKKRKEKNISQEDMAEILNVSRQTISSWENSKSYPDILYLIKICDIYKISLDELLKDDKKIIESIQKEKHFKKKTVTIGIGIIIILILLVLYLTIFKGMFESTNIINKHSELLIKNNEKFVEIQKFSKYNEDEMTDNYIKITDKEFKDINNKLNKLGYNSNSVYQLTNYHIESSDTIGNVSLFDILDIKAKKFNNLDETYSRTKPIMYNNDEVEIVVWNNYNKFINEKIIGKFPTESKEIVISNVLADLIISEGIKEYDKDYFIPKSYNELINSNKYFNFGIDKVKIVGIIDYDLSKYNNIKDITWKELSSIDESEYNNYIDFVYKNKNIYNKIFVSKDFIANLNVNDSITNNTKW